MIPNLVETTKGYAKHERETLSKVVELRNQMVALPADVDPQKKMELSNQLTDSLKSIFALAENYPDLKASQNFTQLLIHDNYLIVVQLYTIKSYLLSLLM